MSSFKITMKDNSHEGIYQLEAAIRNAKDWQKFWQGKDGTLSTAWAESRRVMFATQGSSTGPKWPGYTRQEQRYWLPIKRWSLGVKTIQPGGILRWSARPQSSTKSGKEVLWPSFCLTNDPNYVYQVTDNKVELGSNVPYAANHNNGVGSYTRRTSRKKSGTVTIPTPKRPLTRFGDPFIDAVRDAMKSLAMMQGSGAKVGITGSELSARFLMSVGGRP